MAHSRDKIKKTPCPACGIETNRWARVEGWGRICEICKRRLKRGASIACPLYSQGGGRFYGRKYWIGKKIGRFEVIDVPIEPLCDGPHTETLITLRCSLGHEFKRPAGAVWTRCPVCVDTNAANKARYVVTPLPEGALNFDDWYDFIFKNTGIKLIDVPSNAWTKGQHLKVEAECWCGKKWEPNWTDLTMKRVTSCGCVSRVSQATEEIYDFLKELGYHAESEYSIDEYKVDIYVPAHSFAVEFNGLRWHREDQDTKKYNKYQQYNIVYHGIYEDEWLRNKQAILNDIAVRIRDKEPQFDNNPIIKECEYGDVKGFLQTYDKDSVKKGSRYIGVWLKSVVVAAMVLRGEEELDIVRMTARPSVDCRTFWDLVIRWIDDNLEFKELWACSENRYDDGKVLQYCEFDLHKEVESTYYWIRGRTRVPGHAMKDPPEGVDEREYWEGKGWHRLFDCGKKIWLYTSKRT